MIINPEKPQPTWSIFEIITIFVAIGSLVILGTLGIALLTRLQPDHFPGIKHTTLLQTILLTTVEIVSFTGCIYLLALRRRKLGWQAVGLRITSKVWALIAVLLSILLIPLSGLIAVIIQYLSGSPARNPQLAFLAPEGFSWTALISLLILVGILGPIAEELLFRGIFYQSLRQRWGVWLAAVVSALLFAVMHGDWVVGAVAFVLGLVLAWIFEVSGSLWPAIIIHILNNSIRIIAVYLLLGLGIEIENYITALPILLNGLCSVK